MTRDASDDIRTTLTGGLGAPTVDEDVIERIVAGSQQRRTRRWMREVVITAAAAVIVGGGLAVAFSLRGHPQQHTAATVTPAAHVASPSPSPTPQVIVAQPSPLVAPCDPNAPATPPSRLSTSRNLLGTQLDPVDASVQPRISAAAAEAALPNSPSQDHQPLCGLREVLAYVSTPEQGTIRPECRPPTAVGASPWASPPFCANGNDMIPTYAHTLAWVFVWRTDCVFSGGPAMLPGSTPRPIPSYPPLSCASMTVVDATTGAVGGGLVGGASDLAL